MAGEFVTLKEGDTMNLLFLIIPIRTDLVLHVTIKASNPYGARRALKERKIVPAIREADEIRSTLKNNSWVDLQIPQAQDSV
jgi:hypothetical protein